MTPLPQWPTWPLTNDLRQTALVGTIRDEALDAEAGDFTATIAPGDGTTVSGLVEEMGPGLFGVYLTGHPYSQQGFYAVTASVTGPGGLAPSSAWSDVQVGRLHAGQLASLTVTSIDTNDPEALASDYSATVHWGDGTSSAGAVSGSGGVFAVTADHTYGASGMLGLFNPVLVTLSRPGVPTVTVSDSVVVVSPRLTAQAEQVWTDAAGLAAGVTLGYFEVASTSLGASHYAASVDWGDGSVASSATVQAVTPGLFRVVASHAYELTGWHRPTVTVSRVAGGMATPALRFGGGLFVRAAPPPAPEVRHRLTDVLESVRILPITDILLRSLRTDLNGVAFRLDGGKEAPLSVRETRALLEIGEKLAERDRRRAGQTDRNKITLDAAVTKLLPYADAAGFAAYLRKPATTKTMGKGVQAQVIKAIADLDDDDMGVRVGAFNTLQALGEKTPITSEIFDALDSPSLEVRRRAKELLTHLYQFDKAGMTRYERHLMEVVIRERFAPAVQMFIYRRVEVGGTDHQVSNVARYFSDNGSLPSSRHMDVSWDTILQPPPPPP